MTSAPLWAKTGLLTDGNIAQFTIGEDPILDSELFGYDCMGTVAHVRMLHRMGHINAAELAKLVEFLHQLYDEHNKVTVSLEGFEDGHSYLEHRLVKQLGDIGKKIHLGRSRNDQIILVERLFLRQTLVTYADKLIKLIDQCNIMAKKYESCLMPGYTHQRKAMPTSVGMWIASYRAALTEELGRAPALYGYLSTCPLGAAAGFGVPIPLDRQGVAQDLGFQAVQQNPLNVISSRGRYSTSLYQWVGGIIGIQEKFFHDLAMFTMDEFGYFSLPDAMTTGSSIMPQKKNPDVIELARGRCREFYGLLNTLISISGGLTSSYHRDSQLQKFYILRIAKLSNALCDIATTVLSHINVHEEVLSRACSPELYATHAAYQLVNEGVPFRDAYRTVGDQIQSGIIPKIDSEGVKESLLKSLRSEQSFFDGCFHQGKKWIEDQALMLEKTQINIWEVS